MPELPEAEITRQKLLPLIGRVAKSFYTDFPKAIKSSLSVNEINSDIKNRKIINIGRSGKVIIIELGVQSSMSYHRGERIMALHQRMSGSLTMAPDISPLSTMVGKHVHHRLMFTDGSELWFRDPRKFGVIWYGKPEEVYSHSYFSSLGPDALYLSETEFKQAILGNKSKIKPLLLNQSVIAGIGNIIADETLWMAKIHPSCRADKLNNSDFKKLYKALKKVLNLSISANGSSLKDWSHPDGTKGDFQNLTNAYGRQGKPCRRCKSSIVKISVAGRGTWICDVCQKNNKKTAKSG